MSTRTIRASALMLVALWMLSASPANGQTGTPPIPYKELRSFHREGENYLWRNILVSPRITREELITLAQYLYQQSPRTRFNFFDDDSQFEAFVNWRLHFNKPDKKDYPWPEAWQKEHYLAMITRMLGKKPRTGEWMLVTNITGRRDRFGDGEFPVFETEAITPFR